jgi:hypothetical protein
MNSLAALRSILSPEMPLLVGTVAAHNADGTSTITLPGGGNIRARGQGVAIGEKAFIRAGLVEGPAPNLPVFQLDV